MGKGLALCKVGTVPCEFLSVGTRVLGLSGSATRACQSANYMERGQIHVCQGPAIQWRLQIHFGAGPEESVGKSLAHCKVGVTPCSVFYNSSGCRKSGKKELPFALTAHICWSGAERLLTFTYTLTPGEIAAVGSTSAEV